ncbi:MAG TPA: class I SAM-dependent methyltransferase [Geobacteraceae bacterium]|nr:class I SAM-dependent methyltransferase [Geobacteraceae bacterium]
MKQTVKSIMKPLLPSVVIRTMRDARIHLKEAEKLKTRSIFERAADAPPFLEADMLETLQQKYPSPPEYGYDGKSLERRGSERAAEILRLPGAKEAIHFLELGCWDGMVSCVLRRKGKNTTAIDNRTEGFDERAFREGVRLLQMNASEMQFENESFDFVFSYDAFEHFAQPERVLQEMTRVVRKGGHIYLAFGPLYMSPFGEHASLSITVPYCQFLFRKSLVNDFTSQKGLKVIDFDHVNGWSLEDYRKLWNAHSGILEVLRYYEGYDLSHLDLIRRYPSCFRSKTDCFENLIVSTIEVLFRKS